MLLNVWLAIFGLYLMGWEGGELVPDVITKASKVQRRVSDICRLFLEIYRQQDRALLKDFEETLYVQYEGEDDNSLNVGEVMRRLLATDFPQAAPYVGQCLFWTAYYNVTGGREDEYFYFNRSIQAYGNALRRFMQIGELPSDLEAVRRSNVINIPYVDFEVQGIFRNSDKLVFAPFEVEGEEKRIDRRNEFEE
jgi:hypothetical protein